MTIQKPTLNPTFFYGPIISYQFNGDISKDKGKYRFRFTLTFKSGEVYRTQKSGYKTEAEARKGKEIVIAQLIRNEYIPFDYTVKELFDYWLYYYMMEEKNIRYNTFQTYRNVLYNHLLKVLKENKKLNSVTKGDFEKAILSIKEPSVKRKAGKILKQLFEFACKKHYLTFNPYLAAEDSIKKMLPKESSKRDVIPYTITQIKNLLYMCKLNFPEMYLPLLLSLTLGTRISETIGLKYSDIDFTSNTLYIHRQLGRDIRDRGETGLVTQPIDTKTPNGMRSIPAPDWVIDELLVKRAWYEKQKKMIPGFHDMDYIVCRCTGSPYNRKSFLRDFHKLTCLCGLPEIHWHDLRHMYASVLKNNAVNMKAISEFLGHHSPDFTQEVYVHQSEIAYDCSMLVDEWKIIRPKSNEKEGLNELFIPLTDEDYVSFFANT
nr:tyrosine-type recombinase/integrase [uncultured Sellimonas sp.]